MPKSERAHTEDYGEYSVNNSQVVQRNQSKLATGDDADVALPWIAPRTQKLMSHLGIREAKELATKIGVSPAMISGMVNGKKNPGIKVLGGLYRVYGLMPNFLTSKYLFGTRMEPELDGCLAMVKRRYDSREEPDETVDRNSDGVSRAAEIEQIRGRLLLCGIRRGLSAQALKQIADHSPDPASRGTDVWYWLEFFLDVLQGKTSGTYTSVSKIPTANK